ncbi:putative two-component system sensor histidine kinase, putative heat shock protein [Streptococcus constellatus]|nr:putative two-component system sensor histidine kinase, putative heat shock protein [Streptococcus constellatus]
MKREITIKEAILEKDKPDRQDLLFHELSKVGDELDDSIETIVELIEPQEEFFKKQMLKQIANLRRSSDKLISIKTQILRITNQSLSDTITIDLKEYLKNYFDIVSEESNARVTLNIDNMPVFKSVNVYDLGVLLDNLLLNAVERRRDVEITIYFTEDDRVFHFISNTGPITISPADSIFNLGVTSKANGTGIGMYLCREICEEFGWSINVSSEGDLVDFKIEFGDEK